MKSNKTNNKNHEPDIPDHVIESLARCILPSIRAYFESEEGKREFAEWKKQQEQERFGTIAKFDI